MRKLLFSFLLLLSISPAAAQNPTCPTRPFGTSDNSCASTAFVQAGITGLGLQPINITAPPYNVVCSGGAGSDQAAVIQAAIDATPTGGALYIPACRTAGQVYDLVGAGSCILTVTKAIRIYGDGQGSILFPHASVPNTRDILCVTPASSASGYQFNSFEIISAGGRHALHFNIPLGILITRVSIEHLFIPVTTAGGNSIRVTNDAATASGGMAYSNISHNNLESVYFDTIGDGIVVDNNVIGTSATSTNFAVRASFVAGAGGFTIGPGNVIAGFSCLVCIVNGNGVTLLDNYIETAGANSYGFLVDMNTSGGTMLSPQMLGNQYSVTTGLPIPVRIRAGTQNARLADKHSIIQIGGTHIQVDATATDTAIDSNTQWITAGGVGVTPVVTDNGTRTRTFPGPVLAASLMLGSSFTYNAGVQNTNTLLTVNRNTVQLPNWTNAAGEIWAVQVGGADGTPVNIGIDSFGTGSTTAFSVVDLRRANGSAAIPTAVQSGDIIGVIGALGYKTTGYSLGVAQIRFFANETFTDTTTASRIAILTVAPGTTAPVVENANFITASGGEARTGFGTATPATRVDIASGRALVSGSFTSTANSTGIVEITLTFTNNNTSNALFRSRATLNGSGTNATGIDIVPTFTPSGSISLARGAVFGGIFNPGNGITITDANAISYVLAPTGSAGGAITRATTVSVDSPIAGTVNPTTVAGVWVKNQGFAGVTTSYALLIDAQSGSTTNWAINSTGKVAMASLTADTASTDRTICQDTTSFELKTGTGALGICLGTSGRQFKTSFVPMRSGLSDLMKIGFWNYRYLPGYGDGGERLQYGPTAQDVEAALPDLARHSVGGETINYDSGALLFIGLRAIQELKADNDNLRAEVLEIKRRAK